MRRRELGCHAFVTKSSSATDHASTTHGGRSHAARCPGLVQAGSPVPNAEAIPAGPSDSPSRPWVGRMNGPRLRVAILGATTRLSPPGSPPYTTALAGGPGPSGAPRHGVHGAPALPRLAHHGRVRRMAIDHGRARRRGDPAPPLRAEAPTHLQRMVSELSFGVRLALASWRRPDVVVAVSPALFADWLVRLRLRVLPRRPRTILWVQDLYTRAWRRPANTVSGFGWCTPSSPPRCAQQTPSLRSTSASASHWRASACGPGASGSSGTGPTSTCPTTWTAPPRRGSPGLGRR